MGSVKALKGLSVHTCQRTRPAQLVPPVLPCAGHEHHTIVMVSSKHTKLHLVLLSLACVVQVSAQGCAPQPSSISPQVFSATPLRQQLRGHHNNSAATSYLHLSVAPLASSMGAEVLGLSLNSSLSAQQCSELKHALFRHKMVFARNQQLSLEDQERLTRCFGEFGSDAYTAGIPGHPNVQRLVKEAEQSSKIVFGEGWHTDSPFLKQPPAISILYSVETPPFGGDTMYASTALAYEYLSPAMQQILSALRVHMSAVRVLTLVGETGKLGSSPLNVDQESMITGSFHPLVRVHPITGEKALYVDHTYAIGLEGLLPDESRALLEFLAAHVTHESLTARLRWEPGMVAIWDNRLCIHRAFNDYDGFRREHYRTIVQGEVPISG